MLSSRCRHVVQNLVFFESSAKLQVYLRFLGRSKDFGDLEYQINFWRRKFQEINIPLCLHFSFANLARLLDVFSSVLGRLLKGSAHGPSRRIGFVDVADMRKTYSQCNSHTSKRLNRESSPEPDMISFCDSGQNFIVETDPPEPFKNSFKCMSSLLNKICLKKDFEFVRDAPMDKNLKDLRLKTMHQETGGRNVFTEPFGSANPRLRNRHVFRNGAEKARPRTDGQSADNGHMQLPHNLSFGAICDSHKNSERTYKTGLI